MNAITPDMLPWIYAAVLFLVGLAVGSFLNVVIYRAPLDKSLLNPPSHCPRCNTRIRARDNIPVLGWLLLGGKCRDCRLPISPRYPLIELATGLLWAFAGARLARLPYGFYDNILLGLVAVAFVSAMVVTFFVDLDHLIILDEISLGGTVLSLAAAVAVPALHHAAHPLQFATYHPFLNSYFAGRSGWQQSLCTAMVGLVAGLALSYALYFSANIAFKKQIEAARETDPEIDSALGLGDVKFMALAGALLGAPGAFFTLFAGAIIGSVAGTVLKLCAGSPEGKTGLAGLANRWRTGDSVFPFGPFLVIAALIYFFWQDAIRITAFSTLFPS